MGTSAGDVNAALARYERFYELYLIEGMTPGEVLRRHPEMRHDWHDAEDGQFERPAAFFQQLQRLNVASESLGPIFAGCTLLSCADLHAISAQYTWRRAQPRNSEGVHPSRDLKTRQK